MYMQDNINTTYRLLVDFFINNSLVDQVGTYTNLDGRGFIYFCDNYEEYVHENLRGSLKQMHCGNGMTVHKLVDFIEKMYEYDENCIISLDGTFGVNYEVSDFPIKVQYYGEVTVKDMYISNITSSGAYTHSLTLSKYLNDTSSLIFPVYTFDKS